MAELLIELFSEEIPAKMQKDASSYLTKSVSEALKQAGLSFDNVRSFYGARRLTLSLDNLPLISEDVSEERRGPKVGAPDKAIEGFLRGAGVSRDALEERETPKGHFYFVNIHKKGQQTADIIAAFMPDILHKFPWPKSMRWGSGDFSWVRPLHEILCVLSEGSETNIVPFTVGGIVSGNKTGGHHFMKPALFEVCNFADYMQKLEENYVICDQEKRKELIKTKMHDLISQEGLTLLEDEGLLNEVNGLVEYPVPLIGDIEERFQKLPPEVLKTSMKEHQKFFSVTNKDGNIVKFITISNMVAADDGKKIMTGNQRVLAARLSDAAFFYNEDLKKPLQDHAQKLRNVTYHAKLGFQTDRIERIVTVAEKFADILGADRTQTRTAAILAKADLATSMVYEFPELQGIMGAYYAAQAGHDKPICDAVRDHYKPQGPSDIVPSCKVSVAVALADKLDQLIGFWAIGEKPTGSKDPYALRRAALGIIRLLIENKISVPLNDLLFYTAKNYGVTVMTADGTFVGVAGNDVFITDEQKNDLICFIIERLKVFLRDQNIDHKVIDALMSSDIDISQIASRAKILNDFILSDDGKNVVESYKRATNILTAEEKKSNLSFGDVVNKTLFENDYEKDIWNCLEKVKIDIQSDLTNNQYESAMQNFGTMKKTLFAFFDNVMVNSDNADIRQNRFALLVNIRQVAHKLADFSKL